MKAWEIDPATGHERLRRACDAYRRSIDLLEPGFLQVRWTDGGDVVVGGYRIVGGYSGGILSIGSRLGHREAGTWLAASLCQAPLSIGIEIRYMKLLYLPYISRFLNHQPL